MEPEPEPEPGSQPQQSAVEERFIFLDVDGVLHPIGEPPFLTPLEADWDDVTKRADESIANADDPQHVTRVCSPVHGGAAARRSDCGRLDYPQHNLEKEPRRSARGAAAAAALRLRHQGGRRHTARRGART